MTSLSEQLQSIDAAHAILYRIVMFMVILIIAIFVRDISANNHEFVNSDCNYKNLTMLKKYMEGNQSKFMLDKSKKNPYSINLSSKYYKDGDILTVKIAGPPDSILLFQVKNKANRTVGTFIQRQKDKENKILLCDNNNRAMIHTSISDAILQWKSPNDNMGALTFTGIFVHGNEIWNDNKIQILYDNLHKDCLPFHCYNCLQYTEKRQLCNLDPCDYNLSYDVTEDNKTVKFALGGIANDDEKYLAVAFTKNMEKDRRMLSSLEEMVVIACLKMNSSTIGIKSYLPKDGLSNTNKFTEGKIDLDNNRIRCSFVISLEILKRTGYLDFQSPAHFVYFWGDLRSSTAKLILPAMEISYEKFFIKKPGCPFQELMLSPIKDSSVRHFNPLIVCFSIIVISLQLSQ